ncbi:hypothetical protein F9K88_19650 [Brucella intermedia]|uniref:Membrane protein n=6 Tax=Brucella TaxID=234 RepID=U4VFP3_9HYPH|nr:MULTISPECIES: hypothetical protein [Brucella/Ochrobactrum group]ERM01677.1 membrane protein [Brucella intermedia 229E]HCH71265.1 hypothetical protein [Ochrobactrum sp.]EEQ95285.1 outer membrane lipoprotein-related protein [Brucella intermedia LMG 3301]KAB2693199.1 hypothetical protein F9K72_17140 [Brucella intermedia]KAB2707556.1 hypothetical protein F9K88_19650 [Brucella intermedia]
MVMVSRLSSHPVSVASTMFAVALALSACGTTTGKGIGLGSLGGGSAAQKPETSLLTPLGNGLLGSSANQLNAADRKKALEAEYRALEYSPAGKVVSWSGSGSNSGDVTAAQPYQVGSQNCRQYSHSFTIGGSQQTSRGTACRNPDGSWTPLT